MVASLIYYGHTFFDNAPITKYAQFIVDIIGVYAMMKCLGCSQRFDFSTRKLVYALSLFIILATLYAIIKPTVEVHGLMQDVWGNELSAAATYKVELVCLISTFPAIHFAQRRMLNDSQLALFFIVAWILSVLSYYSYMRYLQDLNGAEFVINNISYIVLSASALMFFVKKPVALIYIGTTFILVLLSAKRSALIGFFVMSLIYFLFLLKGKGKKTMYRNLALLILFAFFIFYLIGENGDAVFAMEDRLQTSGAGLSKRDIIWRDIWNSYSNGSFPNLIFGFGYNASIEMSGSLAHNDWIEILASMGIIGVFIYSYMYLMPLREIRLHNKNSIYRMTIIICLAQLFVHSLSSRAIFFSEYAIFFIAIGYSMVKISKS